MAWNDLIKEAEKTRYIDDILKLQQQGPAYINQIQALFDKLDQGKTDYPEIADDLETGRTWLLTNLQILLSNNS